MRPTWRVAAGMRAIARSIAEAGGAPPGPRTGDYVTGRGPPLPAGVDVVKSSHMLARFTRLALEWLATHASGRTTPEASPARIKLGREPGDGERPDLRRERIRVTPGMDHVDRLEPEALDRNVHASRDGGRIGALELEPAAPPRPHHEQIQLGALMGGPEIALPWTDAERPQYLLQGEPLERSPNLGMGLEGPGALP